MVEGQIENQRRVTTSLDRPSWVGLTAGRGVLTCTYILQPGIYVYRHICWWMSRECTGGAPSSPHIYLFPKSNVQVQVHLVSKT